MTDETVRRLVQIGEDLAEVEHRCGDDPAVILAVARATAELARAWARAMQADNDAVACAAMEDQFTV